jgi:uncharacterized protein (TIGR03435 family)
MSRMRRATRALGSLLLTGVVLAAQASPTEFEVVSIKRSPPDASGGGLGTTPDGTLTMRNQPVRSILLYGSPVPVREIDGFPDWVARDNYDIIAKTPAGSTRQQTPVMMRRLLEDRFKLKGHVEERERPIFALVVARSDGRLGPELKPSTLDCGAPDARCGASFGAASIVSDRIRILDVLPFFSNLVGRPVIDRTGLNGFYALTLRWAPPRAPNSDAPVDDTPEFFTAIQEQLGLKVQPDTMKMPVFVVDSIQRPSEN